MTEACWSEQPVAQTVDWRHRVRAAGDIVAHLPSSLSQLEEALVDIQFALKHDRTTSVKRLDLTMGRYVLKRYNARSLWHRFNRLFRRSRASRCWQMSYAFQAAGLNVARPVLMLEDRFGPLRRKAYFINQWLDGKELLTHLPKMNFDEQRAVAQAVKRAFEKMRAAKLTHGDMKASNLIWVDGELFFIDLDAARRHRCLSTWERYHAKDRRRFIRNWSEQAALLRLFEDI